MLAELDSAGYLLGVATGKTRAGLARVLERNGFERIGLARRYLHIAGDWITSYGTMVFAPLVLPTVPEKTESRSS